MTGQDRAGQGKAPVWSQSMSCCSDRARFSPDTRALTHSTAAVVAKDQQHPQGLLFTCMQCRQSALDDRSNSVLHNHALCNSALTPLDRLYKCGK